MKRCLCAVFVGVSLAGVHLYAADAPRPPFAIPEHYGTMTDFDPGAAGRSLTNSPFIVLIQDLHANVGVQKNIAAILYRLNRLHLHSEGLLVCVEGASGAGDVSLLRSLPGPIRHEFEEMLLHKAYLTGAELAATESSADWAQQQIILRNKIYSFFFGGERIQPVSLSPIILWGVDDPDLYRKNWHAAKVVDRLHYPALNYIHQTKPFLVEGGSPELKQQMDLMVKLVMLRLQPKEWQEYLQHRSLDPKGPADYQETVGAAETYYKMAELRSVAMADNLLKRVGGSPGYTALITGGFHTQEISHILKSKGIPYAVITPRVTVLDQDAAYRARLREEE